MGALAGFSKIDRKSALDRFRLLQPHLVQHRLLCQVAAEAGIAFRTAQRSGGAVSALRFSGTGRKRRDDRGARRAVSTRITFLRPLFFGSTLLQKSFLYKSALIPPWGLPIIGSLDNKLALLERPVEALMFSR